MAVAHIKRGDVWKKKEDSTILPRQDLYVYLYTNVTAGPDPTPGHRCSKTSCPTEVRQPV